MKKVAVVYWSGTGNTEMMAHKVVEGAKEAGLETSLYTADQFSSNMLSDFEAVAFGCPSMGDEQLEETEFEPMFLGCIPQLKGKTIALFGSYGWGSGDWMRSWEEDCKNAGAVLSCESVICNDEPDVQAQSECIALGKSLS